MEVGREGYGVGTCCVCVCVWVSRSRGDDDGFVDDIDDVAIAVASSGLFHLSPSHLLVSSHLLFHHVDYTTSLNW